MGSIGHGRVLHVLKIAPWVRLNDVKAVVHDDPADPVILGLGAVVLVAHVCCCSGFQRLPDKQTSSLVLLL